MLYKPTLGQLASKAYLNHPRYQGCVGHWLMTEGGGGIAFDVSGFHNDGTLDNGPTWGIGQYGSALSFATATAEVRKAAPSWDFTANPAPSFSISAWFKPTTLVDVTGILLARASGNLRMFCRSSGAWGFQLISGSTYVQSADGTGVAGIWQYAVGVYNAGTTTLSIYVNGSLRVSDTPADTNTSASTDDLAIGQAGQGTWFNGLIDEVRVYKRALSANDVWSLYNDPFAEFQEMPRRYYMAAAAAAGLPAGGLGLLGVGR